jgi:glucose-6-phosphate 1-dehydrogenase
MDSSRSDAIGFFGATGDLAFKQIFPALQALSRSGRLDMPIVAIGRKKLSADDIRKKMRDSLEKAGGVDEAAFQKLAKQLRYVAVDYDKPETFAGIKDALGAAKHPLHYVALPPELFEKVAKNLHAAGLATGARLVLEKPFGHDGKSAKALSHALHPFFREENIFRIDHFLGKEQVENIVYLRAANPLVECALNAERVESVQITMAETFGVEGRAAFYDSVGAVRDVVQNHLLELLACIAMELPTERGHEALRVARTKLLQQIRVVDKNDIVRGQVRGYLDEKDVAKDSKMETFAALRVFIDSPRWRDVPFYIRTGKSLGVTATEAVIQWKSVGHPVLEDGASPPATLLRFRIGPDAAIALGVNVKKLGEKMVGESTELVSKRDSSSAMKPYERLLGDAIDGDATLFAQQRAAEESWRVVDPILGKATPVFQYDKGSFGPKEADKIAPAGGWLNPQE